MAIVRYDLRKHYEEAEANAIGTEYFRAGLLPAGDAAALRSAAQKIPRLAYFATTRRATPRSSGGSMPTRLSLQAEMWHAVEAAALEQQTAIESALRCFGHERRAEFARIHAGGMVEPHPGLRHGVWWHSSRSVATCWSAMVRMAPVSRPGCSFILPLLVSTSFLLIADIDCPHQRFYSRHPSKI